MHSNKKNHSLWPITVAITAVTRMNTPEWLSLRNLPVSPLARLSLCRTWRSLETGTSLSSTTLKDEYRGRGILEQRPIRGRAAEMGLKITTTPYSNAKTGIDMGHIFVKFSKICLKIGPICINLIPKFPKFTWKINSSPSNNNGFKVSIVINMALMNCLNRPRCL